MRVLHISTSDVIGGAARAAYRLHRGLHHAGIESRMLVANRRANDEAVVQPILPRRIDHRLRRFIRRRLISIEERPIARSRNPGSGVYSTARSGYIGFGNQVVRDASVLNLHWVAKFIDYPSFFAALPPGKPLVWTLHDVNPFTGGCHYSGLCEKFTTRCGACPQIGSAQNRDNSRRTFNVKLKAYEHLHRDRVALVAPSTWMANLAQRSALLGRFRIEHIPNGVELDLFHPRDRNAARQCLGIKDHERVILFVCDFLDDYRKGFDLLLSAIEDIESKDNIVFSSIGNGVIPEIGGIRHVHFGRIDSDLLLSIIYSIADVLVIPSREDNLPQTAIEALACGCPVVAFAIGGLPDIVDNERNGYLVKPFDIRHLRDAIEMAIARRNTFSAECRARAERSFGLEAQTRAYMRLYLDLSGRRGQSSSAISQAVP